MKNSVEKINEYLSGILGNNMQIIPESIINFWANNYGLKINKKVIDENGKVWYIDRILTVDSRAEVNQNSISWRSNSDYGDLDYSVPYLESILPNWEENDKLIPLMGIKSEDYAEYDLVVINIINSKALRISIWVHDENSEIAKPNLINVSENWDDFLINWNT